MEKNKRQIWQFPWRYAESILLVVGVIVVGFALQLTVGKFDFLLLASPVNYYILAGIVVFLLILSLFRKTQFYQWFTGVPFSVTLIGALLVMTLIMGLVPQMAKLDPHQHDIWTLLGLRQVTTCWPFVMVYFITLLSLGSLIVRRLIKFRAKDYAFYLNHIGLWVLMLAAALGASDMKRFVMHVQEGKTEWRVFSENEDVLELPIAIQLNDFVMEEYAPKLAIIDRESGDVQPKEKPRFFQIDQNFPTGQLLNWQITVKKYIHEAVRNSDSTYVEVPMPGATPAVEVEIKNQATGETKSGWVCGGNMSQLYMTLPLSDQLTMVMTQPEPKKFMSDIDVYTDTQEHYKTILEVNKPLSVGSWTIYQYSYDANAGKASTYSSFELVYDPWMKLVYVGIILFALGSICLMWSGNKKKGAKK